MLLVHTDEAVGDARVPGDLTRLDARVRVLRLKDELHTLDGSCGGLGDCAGHATQGEVDEEVGLLLLRHCCCVVVFDLSSRVGYRQ